MRPLSLQKKLTIFILGILLLGLLIIFFVILPSLRQISDLKESVGLTEKFIEEQYLRTKHLKRSVMSIDEVQSQIEKFYSSLISQGDELRVITSLENLAQNHSIDQNIDVEFVDPADKKTVPKNAPKRLDLPYYKFSFSNNGSFGNHLDYFKSLENLDYYLIIDSTNWKRENVDIQKPDSNIIVNFSAIVYANPI